MFPSIPTLLASVSLPFKRAQLGLFHGKTKLYGNNVPFSKKKTRRTWMPNVQRKRVYSEALSRMVRLKLTARALRSIKKAGGLDSYLLTTRHELIGLEGMRLRLAVRGQAEKNAEAQKLKEAAEPSKSLEGQKVLEQRKKDQLLEEHKDSLQRLQRNIKPTLGFARSVREQAAKVLGLSGLASAQQTIDFLEARRQQLGAAQAS